MRWLQTAPLRARSIFRQRELDDELDEELQFHLEEKIAELTRDGLAPDEARRTVLAETSQFEQCKEECRDARGVRWLQETWRDLVFAARLLRKAPTFTALAILTLGLALGANAVVFSFVSGLLFQPLPYGTPENRLVLIWEHFRSQNLQKIPFSAPEVNDFRTGMSSFDEAAAFRHSEYNLIEGGEPERINSAVVSWNLFPVLAARPKMGRVFTSEDADRTNGDVAIISETLWVRRFASDPNIIGKPIQLSGRPHTVVGVMPVAFRFPLALFNSRGPSPGSAEIWKPVKIAESDRPERAWRTYGVIARLKEGVDLAEANEDLARLSERWQEQFPENYRARDFSLSANLLRAEAVGRTRPAALIVSVAVFALFLIALANVVALLLARAKSRERELAARIALGAGPVRMFRQFLIEGILLALLAGLVALAFFAAVVFACDLPLGGRDFVFCLIALAGISGLVLGVVPGMRVVRDSAPISPVRLRTPRWRERLRDALVIGEIALAFVLLVAAVLLAKSYLRLARVPLGFNPAHVVTMEISLPAMKYSSDSAITRFFAETASEIGKIDGVSSAAFASILPLSGINTDKSFALERAAQEKGAQVPDEEIRVVTPDYFAVLEIPLTRGRTFRPADDADAPPGVMINEAFARRYWPGTDPIGQRMRLNETPTDKWMEVIGMVGDVKHRGLDEPVRPEFYLPLAQSPSTLMTLVARTDRPIAEILPAIRDRIRAIDPEQAIANVRPLDGIVAHSIAPRRLAFALVSVFALIALLIAATGVYGAVWYSFVERRREVAMRVALGASRTAILNLVLKRTLFVMGLGASIGVPIAMFANQHLAPQLFEVDPRNFLTYASVFTVLLTIGVIAAFIPARRAARIDAMPLLRCD